jgi:uncharacterized protein
MNLRRTACVLALVCVPFTAAAQSFNCRDAHRPDEVLICQSPVLARLDERMSSLYFTLRNSLVGARRRALEADQVRWLQSRFACGRDYYCIESAYQRRIRQLSAR